MAISALKAWK